MVRGLLLIAIVLALLSFARSGDVGTDASHTGSMDAMRIDTDPTGNGNIVVGSAGEGDSLDPNCADSISNDGDGVVNDGCGVLGTVENCAQIVENNVQDADEDGVDKLIVDITATNIPATNRMIAWAATVIYDPGLLRVSGSNLSQWLIAAKPGSAWLDISDTLPDTDGSFSMATLDGGPVPSTAEAGSGVLARIEIESVASGPGGSALVLSENAHVDVLADAKYPDQTTHAAVLVGMVGGNACGDDDGDTIPNGGDNCPNMAGPNQANLDGDAKGDICDPDDDGDGSGDTAETACGGDPLNPAVRPERTDLTGNDDGDSETNEPLPSGAAGHDCDGDGYTGANEDYYFGTAARGDQDPCGTAAGWPADFVAGGIPDSTNRITIADAISFIAPDRHFNTSPGEEPLFDARWDLVPGPGLFLEHINISDFISPPVVAPPMLNGVRAQGGPPCPWAP